MASKKREAADALKCFLASHRVYVKDVPFTHTTKVPSGKYVIEADAGEDLLTLYCNAVVQKCRLSLLERPGAYSPLRVDFDFESTLEVGLNRQYTRDMAMAIIGMYQDEIREILHDDEAGREKRILTCILLEKEAPRQVEKKIKDGFHLHFPYFITSTNVFEYIRERIIARMVKEKFWEGCSFTKGESDIVDASIGVKTWFMYGSSKDSNSFPYLVTAIFDGNLEEITIEQVMGKKFLKGRKKTPVYYLPRFLSIRGHLEATKLKAEDYQPTQKATPTTRRRANPAKYVRTPETIAEEMARIRDGRIMEMISTERAESYHSWMDVGWTLFCISNGSEEGFDMWVEFSKRVPEKFDLQVCSDAWNRMEVRNKTIGSLLAMAAHDDPIKYEAWKKSTLRYWLEASLLEKKPNETDVGRVVIFMYRDRFKCVNARAGQWMEFVGHRWRLTDDAIALRLLMIEEVDKKYMDFKIDVVNAQRNASDEDRGRLEIKQKKIEAIISALRTSSFQDRVLKICRLYMYDDRFYLKADEDTSVFCCENGVFDMELGVFREGRPEDFCTLSSPMAYHEYSLEDDEVRNMLEMLKKMFWSEPDLLDYLFLMVCMAASGRNVLKRFVCCTGDTNGGKSVFFRLTELAFGEGDTGYMFKIPRERMIMGPMSSAGAAAPDLARSKGKRMALSSEIAKTERINIGFVKEVTGKDSIYVRGLWAHGGEVHPHFTLFMQCNELPKIPGNDAPTWERVQVIYFGSHFLVNGAPTSVKEQQRTRTFPADEYLWDELPNIAPVFLWYILRVMYPKFKAGVTIPDSVKRYTRAYRMENDIYDQFKNDRLVQVEYDTKAPLTKETPRAKLSEVYTEFKGWFAFNYPSYKERIGKVTMRTELSKLIGPLGEKNSWWGWQLKINDGEADEGETDE